MRLRAPRAHCKRRSRVALIFLHLGRGPAFSMRIAEDMESSRLLVEDNGELGGLENLGGNFG